MGRRFISMETRALVAALVQQHSAKATMILMKNSLSAQTVSLSFIKREREAHLARQRVGAASPLPSLAVPRPAPAPPPAALEVKPKAPRAPLTFEEKLARVAAGAKLVAVHPLRKAPPNYTLGGIASAAL